MKKHIGVISLVIMLALTSFTIVSVTADEIITEGFEGGTMPPENWSIIKTHPQYNWFLVNTTVYGESAVHSGEWATWVRWDDVNLSDEWLISPDFNLSGYESVALSFWANSTTNWPGATLELHVIGEGFDDVIWDLIEDENWVDYEWNELNFDLGAYLEKTINISWRYVGFDGDSFGLDDISLYLDEYEPYISITEPDPEDGSPDVDIYQSNVSVYITADEDNGISVSEQSPTLFDWEIGGDYVIQNSSMNDTPGRKEAGLITPLPYGTTITWYVNVSVGGYYENVTYTFTTAEYNEPPIADFTYLVEGLKVTFDGSNSSDEDGYIANYTWNFDDGNVSYIVDPVHVFSANESYNVTLTVKDEDGASGSYNETIDVANARPIVGFTAESTGKKVTFTSTSYDVDGSIANYTWNFGDGNTSYDDNPVHTYAQENKQYTVTLTVTDNLGLTNSTTQTIKTQDETNPTVEIITPEKALYINGEKKFGRLLGMTIIIGDITIEVNASDEGSGIAKVEFYGGLLGTKLLGNDTEAPYTFEWTRDRIRFFHIQTLKVVVTDNEGNTAMDRMIVRKLL